MVAVMDVVIVPDFVQDDGRKIQALPECQIHTLPPLLVGPRGHVSAVKLAPPSDAPNNPPKTSAGDLPIVRVDDEGGAHAAAEHLVGLGHRRIAVVTFELAPHPEGGLADLRRQAQTSFRPTRLRLDGYKKALGSAGVRWEDVTVYECPENVPEEGAEAAGVLLAMDPRPTALLATSDQLAFGVIEAVKDMGLSVPGDVSVVGFDDVPEAADFDPPLTTVHQDHVEKGYSREGC